MSMSVNDRSTFGVPRCDICLRENKRPECMRCSWIPDHHEILSSLIGVLESLQSGNTPDSSTFFRKDLTSFQKVLTHLVKVVPDFGERSRLLRFTTPNGPLFRCVDATIDWFDGLCDLYRAGYSMDISYKHHSIWTYLIFTVPFIIFQKMITFYNEFKIPFDIGKQRQIHPLTLSIYTIIRHRFHSGNGNERNRFLTFVSENGANPRLMYDDFPTTSMGDDDKTESPSWITSLTEGSPIWAIDSVGNWCPAKVINIMEPKSCFRIHYLGSSPKYDEDILLPSDRVCPLRVSDTKWPDDDAQFNMIYHQLQIPSQKCAWWEADLKIITEGYGRYQARRQQFLIMIHESTSIIESLCDMILYYLVI